MIRIRPVMTGVPGTPWYTNMYFDLDADAAQVSVDTVDAFWTALAGQINADVKWTVQGEVPQIDPATGNITNVVVVDSATGEGGFAANLLPRSAQGLITWRTGVFAGGREIRGRTFVPGMCIPAMTFDGKMSEAAQAELQEAADDLISAPGGSSIGVWSRANGVIEGATLAQVWDEFAVLRSRRD